MVHFTNPLHGLRFHELMRDGGYKSRIRIYSIDLTQNPIDVSNQAEVEEYADLLKYKNSDTDSNGRVAQSGIQIDNYYNKDEQYTIGNAHMCSIRIALINDDGFFASYDWDYQTIIVYWDVWDPLNSMWITCPLGVYWWERPTKTSAVVVNARANDGMSILDQMPYNWPDFSNGLNLAQIYTSIATVGDQIIPYPAPTDWANMTLATYTVEPFDVTNMTRREVLAKLAEIAGANAFISRSGVVMLKAFTDASWRLASQAPIEYYELDGDSGPTPIMKIDIGEYTVPLIDKFIAQVGQTRKEYTVGSGSETMYSINNGFLATDEVTANAMVATMLNVVNGTDASSDMVAYTPISLKAYADPSVEAGDIIRVIRNNTTYLMPIFQQTLKWNGAEWVVEMQNSGHVKRFAPSEADRMSYVLEQRMSGLEPYKGGANTSDNTPYVMRPSFAGNREDDKIIGGTIAWNQLASLIASDWYTTRATVASSDNTLYVTTTSSSSSTKYAQFSLATNHKYLVTGTLHASSSGTLAIGIYSGTTANTNSYRVFCNANDSLAVAFIAENTYAMGNLRIQHATSVSSGAVGSVDNLQVFDLTAMFGSTIADYIYTLESGTAGAGIAWLKSYGFFSKDYYPYHAATLESVNASAHVMRDAGTHIIGNYALDADLQLRGILKLDANNNLYYDGDEYASDGTVTRKYEYRSYTSGDESITDAITDGTHTVVKLLTPTTESADPYTNPQVVDASGTEQYVDAAYTAGTRGFEMPVGHNTDYYNLQSDAQEIYNTPTTDGSYRLACNVVNGKASFEWVPV